MIKINKAVTVPAAEEMSDETFLKHIELRHKKDFKIDGPLHRYNVSTCIGLYRALHTRLHAIAVPGQYEHEHARVES